MTRRTFLPLLLEPTWYAFRNRWVKRIDLRAQSGRDLFLLFFSVIVIASVYYFTYWSLGRANSNPTLAFLPPSSLLGFIFAMLLVMLSISSLLSALGTFFLADDLDLILASPLQLYRFFSGKFAYVLLTASWMPFLFAFPVLCAFGYQYGAPWPFYAVIPVVMFFFSLIPAGVGTGLAMLIIYAVPVYRIRETVLVIVLAAVAGLYVLLDTLRLEWTSLRSTEEILRILALMSAPQLAWLPSYWVSVVFEEFLRPSGVYSTAFPLLLVCGALTSVAFGYVAFLALHDVAYSNIRNKRKGAAGGSRTIALILRRLGRFLSPRFRALVGKELRILSRDVSQAVQLFMLLGLCLFYLYHLRVFSAVESFPEHMRPWWRNFLFMGNVMMGSFITTAICTRFVFPSVSLEGRSYWILETSPINVMELLKAKFWCWFLPVAVVSSVFFASGAFAIGADSWVIVVCALVSFVVCYGIVGLAIGFGAIFAHFEWEHASQLSGGFGSLIFMLGATFLIFLNMIPAGLLLFYRPDSADLVFGRSMIAIAALAIVIFNFYGANLAIRSGAQALARRGES